jgi:hypothetical protein
MTGEDGEAMRACYDEFGDAEWNRLVGDVAGVLWSSRAWVGWASPSPQGRPVKVP